MHLRMNFKNRLGQIRLFFAKTLWDIDPTQCRWFQRPFLYVGRFSTIIVSGFEKHKLTIRASALAYTTLLSIVPLLAVMLSLFKAFGGLEKSLDRIQHFILENLAAGSGTAVMDYLDHFIDSYHSGAMGLIGFSLLILSVIALLATIEKAFNDIWEIPKKRPFVRRFTVYWSMITIGPLLLALSLMVTGLLQSNKLVHEVLALSGREQFLLARVPILTTWALFTGLYLIMPNTNVKIRSALVGGIIGGSLWELAKYGYTIYAAKALVYSKIYGSFGIIPIFLIWIYYTWVVVLLGALITYADQHVHVYKKGGSV